MFSISSPLRALVLLTVLGGIVACSVGPDYVRPAVDAPVAWRVELADAKSMANSRWWEQFQDPVLAELVSTALQKNKDLLLATATIEEAYARYGVARSEFFPQTSAYTDYVRAHDLRVLNPSGLNNFDSALSLSWEIDLWGKIRRSTEAAKAEIMSREESRRGVILTLVSAVARAYMEIRQLDRQLEITKETLAARQKSLELAKNRFDGGITSELPVRQAEAEVAATEVQVPDLERNIAQRENRLAVLLGQNPGSILRGKPIADLASVVSIPAGIPSDVLEQRPDVLAAEADLVAANANIGVAKAEYFPSISLTGLFGYVSSEFGQLYEGSSKAWRYSPKVSMPLLNFGQVSNAVAIAESQKEQATIRYAQTIQNAFREIEDALVGYQKTKEGLVAQERQVQTLTRYYELADITYQGGQTGYLDVLDAERALLAAKVSLAGTQGQYASAIVTLYQALGGGWVIAAEDAAVPSNSSGLPRILP